MTQGRIRLSDQLAELRRELAIRRNVYPTFVERKTLSPEAAMIQTARLEAAIATLEWLQRHEAKIRAAIEQ